MKRAIVGGGAFAVLLVLLALVAGYRFLEQELERVSSTPATAPAPAGSEAGEARRLPGFLYGRVTTDDGGSYEGRLRWGGTQEAFWGDYFNGEKEGNPWVAHVPAGELPMESRPLEIFGLEIVQREKPVDLGRLFMARFGDVARVEKSGADVRVTLKSGTVFVLDRLEASDFDDGVRVWDGRRGVVDLGPGQVRSVDLLATGPLRAAPSRLHGTVHTRHGEFTGYVQWDREECVGSDELEGESGEGEVGVRFDTIRSIARRSPDSSLVTLDDGREVVLSGSHEVGEGNRGVYVDDVRYGRVLVSWDALERVDFTPGGSGPGYDEFPPGHPLTGSVTTRGGRRLAGRLVYDLDESETTETLDAPSQGVDYTIPFGLVASIVLPGRGGGAGRARVTLHEGGELQLERAGDLGEGNAGLLIFVAGGERPGYVPWAEVARVDFDRPPAMYPPLGGAG